MTPPPLTESELLERCLKRPVDQEAWSEFWRRFQPIVRHRIARVLQPLGRAAGELDFDDIVQAAFLRIFMKLPLYNSQRAPLGAYVSLLAVSATFDLLRSRHDTQLVSIEEIEPIASKVEAGEIALEELWDALLAALRELEASPEQSAIVQQFLAGKTPREIGEESGIPIKRVYSTISEYRSVLRKTLTQFS